MKIIIRIFSLLFAVPATYLFVYWVPFFLLPFEITPGLVRLVSLLCAVMAGKYIWRLTDTDSHGAASCIFLGAASGAGMGFFAGFFGPLIFTPEANSGPLLGLFITGPLGFLLGGAGGFIYWQIKRKKPDV